VEEVALTSGRLQVPVVQGVGGTVDLVIDQALNPKCRVLQGVIRVAFPANNEINNAGTNARRKEFQVVYIESMGRVKG